MQRDARGVNRSRSPILITLGHLGLVLVFASLVMAFSWTGFIASDDEFYASSGLGWLHEFPYVSTHFGTARAPVGIPIALSLWFFGDSEFAVIAPTSLYFLGVLVITYLALARIAGSTLALLATLAMATVPLFALKATIAGADLPLLFFSVLSFWLFLRACGRESRFWTLFLSGFSLGLAFLTHETAAALMIFYALLFLAGFAIPRRGYWIMALGFAIMVLVELVYYAILTGDPFYRFGLSMVGVGTQDRVTVPPFTFDDAGNLHIAKIIDPLVMLLIKQEFALLYYFAIPAVWWSLRPNPLVLGGLPREKMIARALAFAGLIWALFAAIMLADLKLLPRYYMAPTYFFFVATALWVRYALWPNYQRSVLILFLAFLGVNLLAISVDNRNPRFGERTLAAFLAESTGPIHTDSYTKAKTEWYCRWEKADCGRLRVESAPPGALFFHNPKNTSHLNRQSVSQEPPPAIPDDEWQVVRQSAEAPSFIGSFVGYLGLDSVIPSRIMTKLRNPNPPVTLYLIPGEP